MARARKDFSIAPECMAALDRLTALAHRLSETLTGDAPSPDGRAATPRAQALAMAMLYFALRADPKDLETALVAEPALEKLPFRPAPPPPMRRPPLG